MVIRSSTSFEKGAILLSDLLAETRDRLIEVVDVSQQLGHQDPVVVAEIPLQSLSQSRDLQTQPAPGEFGQDFGVMGAGHQSLKHQPAGYTQDCRRPRRPA